MNNNERVNAMEKNTEKVLPIVIASIPVYVLSNCLNNLDNPISVFTLNIIVILIACYLWIENKIKDTENTLNRMASNRNSENDFSIIVIQRETEKIEQMIDKYMKMKRLLVCIGLLVIVSYILLKIFYN